MCSSCAWSQDDPQESLHKDKCLNVISGCLKNEQVFHLQTQVHWETLEMSFPTGIEGAKSPTQLIKYHSLRVQ